MAYVVAVAVSFRVVAVDLLRQVLANGRQRQGYSHELLATLKRQEN